LTVSHRDRCSPGISLNLKPRGGARERNPPTVARIAPAPAWSAAIGDRIRGLAGIGAYR
jgi:hypothetical protein